MTHICGTRGRWVKLPLFVDWMAACYAFMYLLATQVVWISLRLQCYKSVGHCWTWNYNMNKPYMINHYKITSKQTIVTSGNDTRHVFKTNTFFRYVGVAEIGVNACVFRFCTQAHWGRGKMAAILPTIFSNEFSWMKMFEFWLSIISNFNLSFK